MFSGQLKSPYVIPGIEASSYRIFNDVQEYFNVTSAELSSNSRKQELVFPRQLVMYLHNQHTKIGHEAIAALLCRDRTTVIHSIDIIHDYLNTKAETPEKVKLTRFMKFYGYPILPRISRSHANTKAKRFI